MVGFKDEKLIKRKQDFILLSASTKTSTIDARIALQQAIKYSRIFRHFPLFSPSSPGNRKNKGTRGRIAICWRKAEFSGLLHEMIIVQSLACQKFLCETNVGKKHVQEAMIMTFSSSPSFTEYLVEVFYLFKRFAVFFSTCQKSSLQ